MNKRFVFLLTALLGGLISVQTQAADPLRVFIRAGVKTHGPNQHDHPRFLKEWTQLLNERGIEADGSMEFPTANDLENTDVLVIYAADGMKIVGEERQRFEDYLRRGGGLVVIHDAVVSGDQNDWAKQVQGGSWIWEDPEDPDNKTKWHEGEVGINFVDTTHPITRGISNYRWQDEIYYDLDMAEGAHTLATSFHSVFVIAPQLWTYEQTWEGGEEPYRAFVSLPGHEYDVFNTPHYRTILLRGIAWAGKQENVDQYCLKKELASLRYPEGGPTPPEEAADLLNLHPEFDIDLTASEPLVEKVISLDWAPDGKLWVAETPEYPNGRRINPNDDPIYPDRKSQKRQGDKVDRPGRDRISWLEDTDGDGRMDEKHVFADGLELVTSLVFYKDGVIVAQAPDILWLRDLNGDGRCDMKEGSEKITLYTGFGTFDTHAVINNFRWGLDGWIYSAIGYSAGHPRSPDGSKDFGRVSAGIIRFKPDGSALEQYASGSCNTWGFDFAPDGELFYTTATCGEHFLHIVMPEQILARGNVGGVRASWVVPDHQEIAPAIEHTHPAYRQIDWVGMFTATAGCAMYNGGAWPDRFDGSHFCSETTMHLVHNEFLRPKGVTYVASKESGREDTEFIAGTDLWFRPVHTRVGPDGALYVVDFYNQAAIHNDTRGPAHGANNAATRPDRDHHFGRIWRVQHRAAKAIDYPELDKNQPAKLVEALKNENGWVRNTAARLLRENGAGDQMNALEQLARNEALPGPNRITALYTLDYLGELTDPMLVAAVNDNNEVVRKNALRIAYERDSAPGGSEGLEAIKAHLDDANPRARLNALIALGNFEPSEEIASVVVAAWPDLDGKYLQSAAVGVAARDPLLYVEASFQADNPAFLADFIPHAVRILANEQDATQAARLVRLLAQQPDSTDGLKQAALEALAANLNPDVVPDWNTDLATAFQSLVDSDRPGLPGAALPLVARWDVTGALAGDLKPVIQQLGNQLRDGSLPAQERGQVAINLLGVHQLDPGIIPAVASLLGPSTPPELQQQIVDALGNTGAEGAGKELIAAYNHVSADLREAIFDTLIKRPDWTMTLLDAMADEKIDLLLLGPGNLHRLKTHPNDKVASRAQSVIEQLRGPEQERKDQLIAQFKSAVQEPGDIENGKQIYTANCANCHVFKGEGRDLAPNLTGMGAHGPVDLLVHIVDPNRVVEPNFLSTSIETEGGLVYDGMVARENRAELVLRNAAADYTIRKENIESRRSTGRSVMPEGFEALGPTGLRDLLAYICAEENQYRIVDLGNAFTADSTKGIFRSKEAEDETLQFRQFGLAEVDGIPFDIVSPAKSPTGNNVVVLKGGSGLAETYPQHVETDVGFAATKLHFLGGVGGWAYPWGGEELNKAPVIKVTLHFAGGDRQEIILRNGVEFADYIGNGPQYDVPGSKRAGDLVRRGQVRWFTKDVKSDQVIERIELESYDNQVAPTLVAITGELAE